ncbi:MAG: hypothetical protein [Circular genetic element sp.]|nr:MAG: hypothetical protein [Circular genetic element sp.]
MESFLRRVPPGGPPPASGGPADPGEWQHSLPALSEFLAATTWADGSSRMPGTLTLFTDDGLWKLCLSDKAQSLVAFCSGSSPLHAFQTAEQGLVAGTLDWRPSQPRSSNKRR